jgi:SAM-dependent methyltransferase
VGVILSSVVSRAVGQSTPLAPREENHHAVGGELSRTERDQYAPSLWPRYVLIALFVPFSFMLLDLTEFLFSPRKNVVYESRNFFGALTIKETGQEDPNTDELTLLNGTTIHGSQFVSDERSKIPTTYYAETSGIGLVLNYFHENRPPGGVRIGDVGLGAGTLAAYALKLDHIRFYEINPTVIDISTSGKWFTYVTDCKKRGALCDIKLGDARLSLQNEGEQGGELPFHVLVLDAFSGDAVPTHLLTSEAMDIYLPRIANQSNMSVDGALLIHVSNRYLDLERVARGAAEHIGFEALQIRSAGDDAQSINSADWVVLTKNKALIAKLRPNADKPSPDDKPPVLWTDAHSSLFEILR